MDAKTFVSRVFAKADRGEGNSASNHWNEPCGRRGFGLPVLVLAALAGLLGGADRVAADMIVAPNAQTASQGGGLIVGEVNARYQEVFSASQFAGLGPITITEIAYRPASAAHAGGPTTDHGVRFDLSTTTAAPGAMSDTFANNVGPDDTVVFSGDWTRSTASTNGPGNTKAFDITLALTTPFLYDPGKGNLLLDIRSPSTTDSIFPFLTDEKAGAGTPVDTVAGNPSTSATGSSLDDLIGIPGGPVVQFTFTPAVAPAPEPSSLALLGVGIATLVGWRRWRHRPDPAE